MLPERTVKGFITLFRGRGDCYGSWDGGCVKENLTPAHFKRHLDEGPHIGVYPCVPHKGNTMCVWGCTDIDYPSMDDAMLLRDALSAVGVTAWVEKTRRGFHVWVFATELIPAKDMRRMFLAAHQVTELNPKEVNPKQETLLPSQVGNYVRLPYPAAGNYGERLIVSDDGTPISIIDFVDRALEARTTPDLIAKLASHYQPPQLITAGLLPPSETLSETVRLLTPLGRAIFRDGPIEGRDRSTTLAHLAFECRKASLNPADALRILEDADLRWGKYMTRGSTGQKELAKLVDRAYGNTQSS